MLDKIFEAMRFRLHSWITNNYVLRHGFAEKETITEKDVSELYSSYLLEKIVLDWNHKGTRIKENVDISLYEKFFGHAPYDVFVLIKEGKQTIEQLLFSLSDLGSEYINCFSLEKNCLIITPLKGSINSVDELIEKDEEYVVKEVVAGGLGSIQNFIDSINGQIDSFNKELSEYSSSLIKTLKILTAK